MHNLHVSVHEGWQEIDSVPESDDAIKAGLLLHLERTSYHGYTQKLSRVAEDAEERESQRQGKEGQRRQEGRRPAASNCPGRGTAQ